MERIPSIIHKMQESYSEGASASELLFLLEDIRRELTRAIVPVDHTKAPVSVWLPQGYFGPQSVGVKEQRSDETGKSQVVEIANDENESLKFYPTETKNEQIIQIERVEKVEAFKEEMVVKGKFTTPFMSVPRPPLVRVIEPDLEDELVALKDEVPVVKVAFPEAEVMNEPLAEPVFAKSEEVINKEPTIFSKDFDPIIDEFIPLTVESISLINDQPEIIQQLPETVEETPMEVLPETKQHEDNIVLPEIEKDDEPETPVVFELDLPQWETEPVHSKWEPLKIPDGFLVGSGFKEALVSEKPRELHEIIANRVLAKPQGNTAGEKSVGVMEKISGGKIADLRKGFSINDRFRFINSLFRGDEAMFDRAIKTINNFDILPEAQYWMQRELVIKLGWNDEDELVQHFHQLVMRRFL